MGEQGFRLSQLKVIDHFLSDPTCRDLLNRIQQHCATHPPPLVRRSNNHRPLHYFVVDGEQVQRHLPEVISVYEAVTTLVRTVATQQFVRYPDVRVACNINITPSGGSYRYHYDRNPLTAILYLNEIKGGETECYPNFRFGVNDHFQQYFDQLLQCSFLRQMSGRKVLVRPRAGRLLIMKGDRCLHSVCPVRGQERRIAIVMSYDFARAESRPNDQLDSYLYERENNCRSDPNYANLSKLAAVASESSNA